MFVTGNVNKSCFDKETKVKKILLVGLLAVAVTGCATGVKGERILGFKGSQAWFNTASIETQRAHFKEICSTGYGIKDNTTEMNRCIQKEWRDAKNKAAELVRASASAPTVNVNSSLSSPRSVQCHQVGPYINCSEH